MKQWDHEELAGEVDELLFFHLSVHQGATDRRVNLSVFMQSASGWLSMFSYSIVPEHTKHLVCTST